MTVTASCGWWMDKRATGLASRNLQTARLSGLPEFSIGFVEERKVTPRQAVLRIEQC